MPTETEWVELCVPRGNRKEHSETFSPDWFGARLLQGTSVRKVCTQCLSFSVHTEPGLLLGPRSVISSLAINWRTLWRHPDCPWLSFFLSSLLFLFFFLFFPSFLKICLFKGESCTEREMRRGRERKKERGRKEGKEEDWIFCLQVHSLDGYSSQGWARLKPKAPNSWSATRVEETQGLEVWSASSQGMW